MRWCLVPLLLLLLAAPAHARDPGRWGLTGETAIPVPYWQGVTGDGRDSVFFDGIAQGLYRTSPALAEQAAMLAAIPADVMALEGYNHIGDIGYDRAEGGRVLLPLECYFPGQPGVDANTCRTGSIGVADPVTLGWRYAVKLDPAEIAKAMWVEPSADGRLLWTSSGPDLLAYAAADVSPANVAAPIHAVRRLAGGTPPSGVTGAAFVGRRLFLAGEEGGPRRVWSVDPRTGARRLEIEEVRPSAESEGLHHGSFLGGDLHYLLALVQAPDSPTGAATSLLQHFVRLHGRPGLRVVAHPAARGKPSAAAGIRVRLAVDVTLRGSPLKRAVVRFAGMRARTDADGRAVIGQRFALPGRYRVTAAWKGWRGRSAFVSVDAPR